MPQGDHTTVIDQLTTAAASGIPEQVEHAVMSAYRIGLCPEFAPALIHLLSPDWHTRHEDIVCALQQLRDPRAVDVLTATATRTFDCLSYDEFRGLARKCTWALADIGTAQAKKALEGLTECGDALIAKYAQKRLDRWQTEMTERKANQTVEGPGVSVFDGSDFIEISASV